MKVKRTIKTTIEIDIDITGATLLTKEEAEQLPKRLREYEYIWWLQSPGTSSHYAAFVNIDGSVDSIGYNVNYTGGIVRPALVISSLESFNLQIGDAIVFGDKDFEIISNDKAFCTSDIGECQFRKDWEAEDANDYEKSDVKKYVDEWFEKAKMEGIK